MGVTAQSLHLQSGLMTVSVSVESTAERHRVICFRTPLHAAAFTDHVECLQLLLSHNAQVNAVDASGKTPLMMAAENGQTNTVGKVSISPVQCVDLTTDEVALSVDYCGYILLKYHIHFAQM